MISLINNFLKYLQIRSVTNSLIKGKKIRLFLSELEGTFFSVDTIKGMISKCCHILTKESQSSFRLLKTIWERDLSRTFEDDVWVNICHRIHFPFTSIKIKETKPT